MFEELLNDIEQIDLKKYREMLINLYEDEDAYTAEIVFGDDELIIGRTDKRYILAETGVDFNVMLKNSGQELKTYFKDNKEKFKQFRSIAYGFVDGDLYYVKKPRKRKKDLPHFSKEDFASFDSVRLKSWLSVYLNEEGKKKYESELFDLAISFKELSKEEMDKWCEILAKYFDYTAYDNLIG